MTSPLNTFHGKAKHMCNVKTLAFGLCTNDELHRREHKEEMSSYIKKLDMIARKVFPDAKISFSLPFSSIRGLGVDYVNGLRHSIKEADVGWNILVTQSMQNKLVGQQQIHLNQSGRWAYIKWLQKIFNQNQQAVREESSQALHQSPTSQQQQPVAKDSHTDPSYCDVLGSQRRMDASGHLTNSPSRENPCFMDAYDGTRQTLSSASLESVLKDRLLEYSLQRMDGPPPG